MDHNKPETDAHRLIVRGSRSAAFGLFLRLGARVLFLVLAARLFGAALFGAYTLAVAVVEVGVIVGGLGTKRILFKLLDEGRAAREPVHIVLDAAAAVLVASLAIAGLIMAVLFVLPRSGGAAEAETALLMVAPMIAGQALLDLFSAATRWHRRMRYDVVGRSIVEPYVAVMAVALCWIAGLREGGLLVSYWAGTLAALAYVAWGVWRCFGSFKLSAYRFSWAEVVAILRGNSPATLNDFLNGGFARLDLYFVGLLLGEAAAGIYGMARQFRTPIRQIRQSFDGLLAPLIARTLAESGAAATGLAAASATRLILAIQLPLLLTLAIVGEPLLVWLGPTFAAGYSAMLLLAAAETIQGAFGVSDLILLYRRPSLALVVTGASALVNFAGGWLLVTLLGIEGAALAVLGAALAGALLRRFVLGGTIGARSPLVYGAGPMFAAILAGLVAIATMTPAGWSPTPSMRAAALGAVLLAYGAALWTWLRLSRQSLRLTNFRI